MFQGHTPGANPGSAFTGLVAMVVASGLLYKIALPAQTAIIAMSGPGPMELGNVKEQVKNLKWSSEFQLCEDLVDRGRGTGLVRNSDFSVHVEIEGSMEHPDSSGVRVGPRSKAQGHEKSLGDSGTVTDSDNKELGATQPQTLYGRAERKAPKEQLLSHGCQRPAKREDSRVEKRVANPVPRAKETRPTETPDLEMRE
jgi:hypothetical protein